jgi:hypothetical protein
MRKSQAMGHYIKTIARRFLISILVVVELIVVFYSTTFLMSYLYELDSALLPF